MLRAAAIAVGLLACLATLASTRNASAQSASAQMGRALVNQHCGVCHTKPDLVSPQFGPSLDRTLFASAGEADIRKAIADGTPDMPGFDLTLDPTQIDAIVDYIKQALPTTPKHAPAATTSAGPAGGGDN
jgi:mono/diheme cytochrome c family protein